MTFNLSFRRQSFVVAVILFSTLAPVASRQARGQILQGTIDGNVTDASQAAIVGARVVATEQRTNFTRDTTTNAGGLYTIPTLPPRCAREFLW
ncbi:MAG TPA: carboxypeptidase-like regulatory domain-containing protein [Bryobacterales bacterium]|jgi:hypothetical protein|nr:carboxypeptidase-like regulatory domain-containing protein [Bryobacterales bacterium]